MMDQLAFVHMWQMTQLRSSLSQAWWFFPFHVPHYKQQHTEEARRAAPIDLMSLSLDISAFTAEEKSQEGERENHLSFPNHFLKKEGPRKRMD